MVSEAFFFVKILITQFIKQSKLPTIQIINFILQFNQFSFFIFNICLKSADRFLSFLHPMIQNIQFIIFHLDVV